MYRGRGQRILLARVAVLLFGDLPALRRRRQAFVAKAKDEGTSEGKDPKETGGPGA